MSDDIEVRRTDLVEDHCGNLLGRERVGAAEVLHLDLRVAIAIVNDLEGPRFLVLLDDRVVIATANQAPTGCVVSLGLSSERSTLGYT